MAGQVPAGSLAWRDAVAPPRTSRSAEAAWSHGVRASPATALSSQPARSSPTAARPSSPHGTNMECLSPNPPHVAPDAGRAAHTASFRVRGPMGRGLGLAATPVASPACACQPSGPPRRRPRPPLTLRLAPASASAQTFLYQIPVMPKTNGLSFSSNIERLADP